MSVLLINARQMAPAFARIVAPPLGLCYLSSSLKAQGIEARVVDADALSLSDEQLADLVKKSGAKIVGVTATTPAAESAYHALEVLRPHTKYLVLGGPHVSALGPGIFDDCKPSLDAAVCGEAEETFPHLVKEVLSGSDPKDIPGVLLPGRGGPAGEWPRIKDLDALPLPDRGSVPAKAYRHPLFGYEPFASMITSRGCPYKCIFCDKHTCGSTWRARGVDSVLAEVERIAASGISRIMLYDDLFTLSKERVQGICKGIVDRGLSIRWKCEGRVNRVDPETLEWMKRAGCEMIAYGVETATAHGLEFLQKDIAVDQVREAFAMTRKAGILTLGYFLLGIPGETVEDEMETISLAIDIKADYAQFGTLSPFPGTPLYDYAIEKGWLSEQKARGPAELGSRRPFILDGYWSAERLDQMLRVAHRSFYFRPGYILERLKRVRGVKEMAGGAAQAAKLGLWMARSRLSPGRD